MKINVATAAVGLVVLVLAGTPGKGEETNVKPVAKKADPRALPLPALAPPKAEAVKRWQGMRFGMFIHWGPVSLTGREIGWSRGSGTPIEVYDNLYKKFNPIDFNAAEWAQVAKDSGMKYMVLTTKHHDGFCLWDTKQTDYNIMNSPFGRDVVKELAEACRKADIAFGTYYSVCDWHNPDFPLGSPGGNTRKPNPNMDRYTEYMRNQLSELIKNYGPLLTIWFDVAQETGPDRGIPTANMVRALQPDILVNNRFYMKGKGDYGTPEQNIGPFDMDNPWETCMTIGEQWAWKPNDNLKSLKVCLQTLVSTSGGDGNLLFNVGPMPDGKIEKRQVDRLREIGLWLGKYGDSVYGTRGGPFKPGVWGASTRKDSTIFVHVFKWPAGALELPAIPAKVKSARVLTGGEAVLKQNEDCISLDIPAANRDETDTLIALDLDRPAMEIAPVSMEGTSLMRGASARASNVNKSPGYGPEKALDGDENTRWATDAGTKQAWIEVDLGKPKTFSSVIIREWYAQEGGRIRSFELQYKAGEEWKTIIKGGKVGDNFSAQFPAVTAQVVRLNILDAIEGPTIKEFQLLERSPK